AARARMDRDNRVARVVFAREQGLGFELLDHLAQVANLSAQIFIDGFAFAGELEVSFNILRAAREIAFGGEHALDALALAHYLLGLFLIGPEIGVGSFLFYFGKLLAQAGRVKDTPADRGPCCGRPRIRVRVLPPSFSVPRSA